jgi:putative transposase
MKKSRFSEEKIIAVLKQAEAGVKVSELVRKHGISEATFYNWKAEYGGLDVSQLRRLKELEAENTKLKRPLADAEFDKATLKDLLGRKPCRPRSPRLSRRSDQVLWPVGDLLQLPVLHHGVVRSFRIAARALCMRKTQQDLSLQP